MITSVQSGWSAYCATCDSFRAERPHGESGNTAGKENADTLNISEEARQRAQALQRGQAGSTPSVQGSDASSSSAASAEYPLEAYAMPGWFANLFGGYNEVSITLGASWEEARTGYDKLDAADKEAYDEYAETVSSCYREELQKAGISNDTGDYYYNFLQNQETQDAVRQSVYARLQENPRAMELMNYFGISL